MELNINFNLNITIKHENQPIVNTENHATPICAPTPVEPAVVMMKPKRIYTFRTTRKQRAKIQRKIKEITANEKGLSKLDILIKAASITKTPVDFLRIQKPISFPSGYDYAKVRHSLTDRECKDVAALFAGGAGKNAIIMAIGAKTDLRSASIVKHIHSITEKDVERTKEKYKDVLILYGVYDRMTYDKNRITEECPIARYSKTKLEDTSYRQKRIKFTHDQVSAMVAEYESLPVSAEASLESDMRYMCNKFGINSTNSMKYMLFAHESMPGYEDIPTPDVKNFTPCVEDETLVKMIEEIRYLRDVKRFGAQKITEITGFKFDFVRRAYKALLRPDIKVSPEMKKIFDERYKGVK